MIRSSSVFLRQRRLWFPRRAICSTPQFWLLGSSFSSLPSSSSNNISRKMSSFKEDNNDKGAVKESVIRKMTRLAQEHGAVNLSQGFPNEAPPYNVRLALAHAVLTGRPQEEIPDGKDDKRSNSLLRSLSSISDTSSVDNIPIHPTSNGDDVLNQYSPPFGRGDVLSAIAAYYKRFYDFDVLEDNITVTLGATEALASALRSLGKPGDKAVVFEPFHELYPSQCKLFYLECDFVTLKANPNNQTWNFDPVELENALKDAKILLLNTPHNPTGKIFTRQELKLIVDLCLKYQAFPEIRDQCLVCNSLGKSASATGWRLGWCIHPAHISSTYRGIHDQLAVMSPHPMQYATLTYLSLPDEYFKSELKTRYKSRVETLAATLKELGFGVLLPEGAYYLFVNYRIIPALSSLEPMEAALYMLKEIGVACVPGDNFYGKAIQEQGSQYLRFAACRSESDIQEACERLKQHLSNN